MVGASIGYDYQINSIVVGVTGDYLARPGAGDSFVDGEDDVQALDVGGIASVRAKLGYTFGNVLAYGTVGYAWADYDFVVQNGEDRLNIEEEGVVFGGGVAWKFANNLSFNIEYLRYDVGARVGGAILDELQDGDDEDSPRDR